MRKGTEYRVQNQDKVLKLIGEVPKLTIESNELVIKVK